MNLQLAGWLTWLNELPKDSRVMLYKRDKNLFIRVSWRTKSGQFLNVERSLSETEMARAVDGDQHVFTSSFSLSSALEV